MREKSEKDKFNLKEEFLNLESDKNHLKLLPRRKFLISGLAGCAFLTNHITQNLFSQTVSNSDSHIELSCAFSSKSLEKLLEIAQIYGSEIGEVYVKHQNSPKLRRIGYGCI